MRTAAGRETARLLEGIGPRLVIVVREGGLEPPHPCEYWHLKPARLPIPPLAHVWMHRSASNHERLTSRGAQHHSRPPSPGEPERSAAPAASGMQEVRPDTPGDGCRDAAFRPELPALRRGRPSGRIPRPTPRPSRVRARAHAERMPRAPSVIPRSLTSASRSPATGNSIDQRYRCPDRCDERTAVTSPDNSPTPPTPVDPRDADLSGIRGWLFDLDGVLTPTAVVHMHAWARLFTPFLEAHGAEAVHRRRLLRLHRRQAPLRRGAVAAREPRHPRRPRAR